MVNVTFSGQVSSQAAQGEQVNITVTKPDGTTDVLTATTGSDGSFSVVKDYVAGEYSAVGEVDADADYTSATSTSVSFNVGLGQRSITLNVQVAS